MPRAKPVKRKDPGEVTLNHVARSCEKPVDLVRRILREDPKLAADKDTKDLVFSTARSLGYDLGKLKLSKRLDLRLETLTAVLDRIEQNPGWGRTEILAHMKGAADLANRVQVRMYGRDR